MELIFFFLNSLFSRLEEFPLLSREASVYALEQIYSTWLFL